MRVIWQSGMMILCIFLLTKISQFCSGLDSSSGTGPAEVSVAPSGQFSTHSYELVPPTDVDRISGVKEPTAHQSDPSPT